MLSGEDDFSWLSRLLMEIASWLSGALPLPREETWK